MKEPLNAFCNNIIVCYSQINLVKISIKIFKGQLAHATFLSMSFFSIFCKSTLLLFVFLTFDFQVMISLSVFIFWYSVKYLGNIN